MCIRKERLLADSVCETIFFKIPPCQDYKLYQDTPQLTNFLLDNKFHTDVALVGFMAYGSGRGEGNAMNTGTFSGQQICKIVAYSCANFHYLAPYNELNVSRFFFSSTQYRILAKLGPRALLNIIVNG